MKNTIRALAIPTATVLLLAACGGSDPADEAEPSAGTTSSEQNAESDGGGENADESDSWPVVEDEDGNVVENPEDEAVDAGAATDESGNVTSVEFGDETLNFDLDSMTSGDPMSPGVRMYGMSENGGEFVITTKTEPVEELEAYREKAGGDPVTYMSVDIDNREGTENINMYQVAVYDAEGNEYVYTSADEAVDGWQDLISSDDVEAYNEGVDLVNKYLNQGASPHERSTMILAGPELPEEFTAVVAMPTGGFESVPMMPIKD